MANTALIVATPKDASGNPLSGRVITFVSSDSAVATVDNSGLVTAVAIGTCTITVSCEGISVAVPVTVVDANAITSVVVSPASGTIQQAGTLQLSAKAYNASGVEVTPVSFAWTSSDPTKATVDSAGGLVTGVAAGAATITAAIGSASGTCAITVVSSAVSRQFWWEADTLALTNGQLVASWLDQVASVNLNSPYATNQPTYNTNQIGGLPGVTFVFPQYLKYPEVDAPAWTRFFVGQLHVTTVGAMYLWFTPGGYVYVATDGTVNIGENWSTSTGRWHSAAAALTFDVPHVIDVSYDGSSTANNPVLKIDNNVIALTQSNVPSGTRTSDAGTGYVAANGPGNEIGGPLSAYIKINVATDQSTERTRLGTKYGITLA